MNPKTKGVNTLLIANIAIFAIGFLMPETGDWIRYNFALFFPKNEHFQIWQPMSHMFLHGSPAHLLFNMFALFSFGTVLERIWGTKKFITFYFISGIGAAIIYTLINQFQFNAIYKELIANGLAKEKFELFLNYSYTLPGVSQESVNTLRNIFLAPTVGASGAIYGILVAFGITFPDAKLNLMFIPVPIAAKVLIPIILLLDLFSGVTGFSLFGGGIAHFAHIGGAVIGFILMRIFNRIEKKKDPNFSFR